jgi:hypothetical protein
VRAAQSGNRRWSRGSRLEGRSWGRRRRQSGRSSSSSFRLGSRLRLSRLSRLSSRLGRSCGARPAARGARAPPAPPATTGAATPSPACCCAGRVGPRCASWGGGRWGELGRASRSTSQARRGPPPRRWMPLGRCSTWPTELLRQQRQGGPARRGAAPGPFAVQQATRGSPPPLSMASWLWLARAAPERRRRGARRAHRHAGAAARRKSSACSWAA